MFANPLSLYGIDVVVEQPRLVQKLILKDDLPITDKFRAEMNAWLLDMFGTKDVSVIPNGTVYMFNNTMIMRPEMAVMLTNCIV